MDKQLQEYRSHIITAKQQAQEDFDKTVLTLSGGALGISFVFVKDIVGNNPLINSWALFAAWIAWGFSVTCILVSYYASQQALRKTIKQIGVDMAHLEEIILKPLITEKASVATEQDNRYGSG